MRLLYRSAKYNDEIFCDYLDRLGFFNGFKSAKEFSIWLIKLYHYEYGGKRDKNTSKIDDRDYMRIVVILEQLLRRNILFENIRGPLPWYAFDIYGDVKICPECWEESCYIRLYWRFSEYCFCHKHNAELISPESYSYEGDLVGKALNLNEGFSSDNSYHLVVTCIEYYQYSDYFYTSIGRELDQKEFITDLIKEVVDFFSTYMDTHLCLDDTLSLLESGTLVGLNVTQKMEGVYKSLLVDNTHLEKHVRIFTAIATSSPRYFFDSNINFDLLSWVRLEIQSIDELLYAYLAFHRFPFRFDFPLDNRTVCEILGFENLPFHMDYSICGAIKHSAHQLNLYYDLDITPSLFYHPSSKYYQSSLHYQELGKMLDRKMKVI